MKRVSLAVAMALVLSCTVAHGAEATTAVDFAALAALLEAGNPTYLAAVEQAAATKADMESKVAEHYFLMLKPGISTQAITLQGEIVTLRESMKSNSKHCRTPCAPSC